MECSSDLLSAALSLSAIEGCAGRGREKRGTARDGMARDGTESAGRGGSPALSLRLPVPYARFDDAADARGRGFSS